MTFWTVNAAIHWNVRGAALVEVSPRMWGVSAYCEGMRLVSVTVLPHVEWTVRQFLAKHTGRGLWLRRTCHHPLPAWIPSATRLFINTAPIEA